MFWFVKAFYTYCCETKSFVHCHWGFVLYKEGSLLLSTWKWKRLNIIADGWSVEVHWHLKMNSTSVVESSWLYWCILWMCRVWDQFKKKVKRKVGKLTVVDYVNFVKQKRYHRTKGTNVKKIRIWYLGICGLNVKFKANLVSRFGLSPVCT